MFLHVWKSTKISIYVCVPLLLTWWLFYSHEFVAGSLPESPSNVLKVSVDSSQPESIWDKQNAPTDSTPHPTPSSTLPVVKAEVTPTILYAYSPSEWALPNLEFFLIHGVHTTATFIFIFNGALELNLSPAIELDADTATATKLLELFAGQYPNIHIFKRPNTCGHLAAFADVLLANDSTLYHTHERFILMNASIRGPFIPFWSDECWSRAYLRQIDELDHNGKQVKLVSMAYNHRSGHGVRNGHVQSLLIATDKVGMEILLGKRENKKDSDIDSSAPLQGLARCVTSDEDAIGQEVSLTSLIVAHNYTVRTMMVQSYSRPIYHEDGAYSDVNGTIGAYEETNQSLWETMFVRTNSQAVDHGELQRVTDLMNKAVEDPLERGGSWDVCRA